ncbi:MAG: hypothetical protein KGL13_08935 [Gammaproteobacteria bacterium]|nr:hypothetical protein [Gammaproteobacteria bacterium]
MKLQNTVASLIFCISLSAPPCFGCNAKLMPDTKHLERYSVIFIGEVSSVRQDYYQEQAANCYSNGFNTCQTAVITKLSSPVYDIFVLTRISLTGSPQAIMSMHMQGCGIQIPQLGGYGIFFIPKDKTQPVIPIYQSESFLYSNLLLKLGNLKPAASHWDEIKD